MPHRDFEVDEQPPDPDHITFTLAGHKFTCVPLMPYTIRAVFGQSMVYKREFKTVIRGCLVEADEALFDRVLAAKDRPVLPERVEAVFWYLVDAYSEREGENLAPGRTTTPVPADSTPAQA